jgi:hypothetical protein
MQLKPRCTRLPPCLIFSSMEFSKQILNNAMQSGNLLDGPTFKDNSFIGNFQIGGGSAAEITVKRLVAISERA